MRINPQIVHGSIIIAIKPTVSTIPLSFEAGIPTVSTIAITYLTVKLALVAVTLALVQPVEPVKSFAKFVVTIIHVLVDELVHGLAMVAREARIRTKIVTGLVINVAKSAVPVEETVRVYVIYA